RHEVDRCCEHLQADLGLDLRNLLFPAEEDAEAADDELEQTRITQPALFVIEYATARLWESWGITPEAMIGHSIGEYVAACLAGVFTLEEALALVAARGRLMQSLPPGAMLAVPLSEDEVGSRLDPQLSIATINAPRRCVVSGPEDAIEAFREQLAERGVRARRLHTSHAFHSAMMEPILQPFIEELSKVELKAPQIPYVSNVSGTWITADETTDPGYWATHLRSAVRFADGVHTLLRESSRVLLEVGPGNTLTTLAQRHPDKGADQLVMPSIRHPRSKEADDQAFLLATLGQLWLAGVSVDWRGFYRHQRRRRVLLPTYPFERRRYWIDKNPEVDWTGGRGARRKELSDWFYLPSWKPSVAPAPPTAISATESGEERWLVFLDGEGLGVRTAERLAQLGREVLTVSAGAGFRQLDDRAWEIAPGQREDYDALFEELRDGERLPRRILHLWNVYRDRRDLAEALDQSFYSLLFLAQALAKTTSPEALHLAVVSSDMHRLGADHGAALHPEKATLLGPCQVAPNEIPRLRSVAVDVTLADVDDELIDQLIVETAEPTPGAIVAYRDGDRWLRGYEAVTVDRAANDMLRIRSGGTYLITGGLGGFGLTFAEYLAREFQANLVLVGRSALPGREQWDEWLAGHGEDERTSRKIRRLRKLEELGAKVLPVSADITDREEVRELLSTIRERFGELHGVIHAAGVPGGGLLQLKTREMAAPVLAPKVQGTLALAAELDDTALDFFVLCSSTIAVLGTFGQVDYCAGNCFLDAFADAHAGHRNHPVSINWGAWKEVGMAVETAPPASLRPAAAAEATAAEPARPDDGAIHPLIDRQVSATSEEVVYATDFDVARHWVLDEHRILGNPAIPGTTYLEMARAAFAHHTANDEPTEITDAFFFQPLMVKEGETREVRVILEGGSGEEFQFRVVSHTTGAGGEAEWTDHARGKVRALAAAEPARWDLGEIIGRCGEEHTIEGGAVSDESKLVYWGPRWQSLRTIHLGEREGLARLSLPEEFTGDLERLALHPALVDVATALTSGLTEGENYLPLSYHKVRIFERLPGAIYSYLRLQGDPGGETVAADISLLDDSGRELVAIEHFTMKRVGEARQRLARAETASPAATAAGGAGAGQGLFAAAGMRPAEGVEVLRRVLSRVRQPRIVVSPRDLAAMRRQMAAAVEAVAPATGEAAPAASPQSIHPRPNLPTPYAPPANEIESQLSEIWQNVLGLEQVGVHDNFFELGGDSVLGITVISQTAEAGYQLAPEHLFEHQTVAELSELLASEAAEPAATPEGRTPEGRTPAGDQDPDFADSGLAPDELEKVLAKLEEIT
ncbi:MAG: SDR family NAD(P)-dependent oxidoreductase, partial [Thermoanaerobaculia bacterium]